MACLHTTVELSIGGNIIHTKIDTLRAGATLSPKLQSIFAAASDQVEAVAPPTWCGEVPRVCLVIDRDCIGWRHVMNYLRAVELGYDIADTMGMVGNVELKERHAAVVEARWLGLSKLEGILRNMPDFTRQGLQARVANDDNASDKRQQTSAPSPLLLRLINSHSHPTQPDPLPNPHSFIAHHRSE